MTDIELLIALPWLITGLCVFAAAVVTRIVARRTGLPRARVVRR